MLHCQRRNLNNKIHFSFNSGLEMRCFVQESEKMSEMSLRSLPRRRNGSKSRPDGGTEESKVI